MGQEIPDRQNGQVLPVTLFFLLNVRVRESVMCPGQLARVPRSWRVGRLEELERRAEQRVLQKYMRESKTRAERKKMSPVVCTNRQTVVKANAGGWGAQQLPWTQGERPARKGPAGAHKRDIPRAGLARSEVDAKVGALLPRDHRSSVCTA